MALQAQKQVGGRLGSNLVELGFLSHPDEERLLASEDFQQEAAEALAEGVRGFFERYPPGSQSSGQGGGLR